MKNTNLKLNKTKLVARLMLIILLLISVFILSACEWMNSGSTKQSELKTTKPTSIKNQNLPNTIETVESDIELENGEVITVMHGKDFNQDDIDFILTFHGNTRNDLAICDPLMGYDLEGILTMGKMGHSILLAHFENPYFISAYLKSDAPDYELNKWGDYKFDVTKYVWYKFYDFTQVVDEIDGMKRTDDTYLLYDCTIKRDIVNGVEYNKNCKYYMEFESEYTLKLTTADMLLYYEPHFMADIVGDQKYIPYMEYGGGTLEICVDENGVEYLYFGYRAINQDGTEYENAAKNLFGEHYEPLLQHFEVLNEIPNEDGLILQYAGIRLDLLAEYLTDGR